MTIGPDQILDANGDLDMSSGDTVLGSSVSQGIRIALLFIAGEWFLDTSVGIPYFDQVFVKGPNLEQLKTVFRSAIVGVPGVQTLNALTLSLDTISRTLNVAWSVSTGDGTITGSQVLGI